MLQKSRLNTQNSNASKKWALKQKKDQPPKSLPNKVIFFRQIEWLSLSLQSANRLTWMRAIRNFYASKMRKDWYTFRLILTIHRLGWNSKTILYWLIWKNFHHWQTVGEPWNATLMMWVTESKRDESPWTSVVFFHRASGIYPMWICLNYPFSLKRFVLCRYRQSNFHTYLLY